MFELEELRGPAARIKVVGVGGAGGNVVNNMAASNLKAVELVAVNTDEQALQTSLAQRKVQIGMKVTRGLGAGSKPEVGRQSAIEDRAEIERAIEGSDMVFITAGMGGGTGTGAAPVVAEAARGLGALTVAIVTKPFFFEGGRRITNAELGLAELKKSVDAIIVVPNDRISTVVEKGTPLLESFSVANDILRQAVQGISDIVLVPGLINVDFADVKTVMECSGRAVMGMGIGRGEGKAREAAKKALFNPLLEENSVEGASGILLNITGGLELSLSEVEEAASMIYESAAKDAIIILGSVIDPELKDEVRVTIVATGFKKDEKAETPKVQLPQVRKWMAPQAYKGSERVLSKTIGNPKESLEIPALIVKTEGFSERA